MKFRTDIFLLHSLLLHLGYGFNDELRLYKDLFGNYSSIPRPVFNTSHAVNVTIGLTLSKLIDVKEKEEVIKVSSWTRQFWYNEKLVWKPGKYGGIKELNVDPTVVWKPDIYLYNNVEEEKDASGTLDTSSTKVILRHDGKSTWLAPVILRSKCDMDMTYFPFDTQRCHLKFGSWTYDKLRLDLYNEADVIDTGMYTRHSEWSLRATVAKRNEKRYGCCVEVFPDVTFTITISRRSLFYQLNLVLPILVIGLLALCTFLLPAESGERIGLLITLLLSMTVFMLVVMETIPATGESVPLVTIFFKCCMVEQTIMIIVLCYIMKMYHKQSDDPPMSSWLRRVILDRLSYVLHVRTRVCVKETAETNVTANVDSHDEFVALDNHDHHGNINHGNDIHNNNINDNSEKFDEVTESNAIIMAANSGVLISKFDSLSEKLERLDENDLRLSEWRLVAMTLDRVMMFIFFLLYAIFILMFYALAPGFY